MLRNYWPTWRTFGLAFAIVLTPALMQTGDSYCEPNLDHDSLAVLNVSVGGEDMIAFDPGQRSYEVMLAEDPGMILIRAETINDQAAVLYNLTDGCESVVKGTLPEGGGLFTLEPLPEGHSWLKIWVKEVGYQAQDYTVFFARPETCQ